jgi:hypothetical protein
VELYEQIRREYEFGVGSVIGVARKLGVHRRMVREAVRNAVHRTHVPVKNPLLILRCGRSRPSAIIMREGSTLVPRACALPHCPFSPESCLS